MPQLIAINEIHRAGKDGKPEVINPGKSFSATAEEVELFVNVHGAAKPAGKATDDADDNDDNEPKALADMTGKELTAKATELGCDIPKGNPSKAVLIGLIEAKLAEGDLV